ncbi:MAG TPA: cobalamin-binding protein [Polyangiales bacterium]|nr:cobalamin-binding protein [Polyangiales bacterium]
MAYFISGKPERIVCLTEEPTETLYLLGEGARVVGISAYTERPPEARRDKPVVSAFIGGSVAKIKALAPDLVIGFSDIQAELAKQLIAENLQVLIFNQRSVQEILDTILVLGRLVGANARAEQLVAGLIARVEAAQQRAATRGYRPSVYFEEWDAPMISAIQWVSELIEIAGGRDVFADRAHGKLAKERFATSEEVLARAPELYLASWCGKAFDRASVLARAGWDALPAVRSGELHELDPAIILQPGPACLTDGLDALEAIISRYAGKR